MTAVDVTGPDVTGPDVMGPDSASTHRPGVDLEALRAVAGQVRWLATGVGLPGRRRGSGLLGR